MAEHPLQPALNRSSRALRTVTDLIEIAKSRKSPKGRSDARQSSLYRAIVTASVGVVEESTEALMAEALRAQGIPSASMPMLKSVIARLMQTPNSDEIRKLMSSFLGYEPTVDLKVRLRTSAPAFRSAEAVGGQTSHELWTIYNQVRTWTGVDAAQIWDRFVKIRHSFAHQDSTVVLFTKEEVSLLRTQLSTHRASTPDEITFVERLNATSSVRVLTPTSHTQDPVRDWRLHETHAINALLAGASVVASLADGLANHLDAAGASARSQFDPLQLSIKVGDWVRLAGPTLSRVHVACRGCTSSTGRDPGPHEKGPPGVLIPSDRPSQRTLGHATW